MYSSKKKLSYNLSFVLFPLLFPKQKNIDKMKNRIFFFCVFDSKCCFDLSSKWCRIVFLFGCILKIKTLQVPGQYCFYKIFIASFLLSKNVNILFVFVKNKQFFLKFPLFLGSFDFSLEFYIFRTVV